MSIIVKGMDMPTSCGMCRLADKWADDTDEVYIECLIGHTFNDCPLVEIPTPHGRLIEEHYPGELKAKHAEGVFIIYRSADEDTDRFILEEEAIS